MKGLYQRFSILGLILVTLLVLSGCATRGYVRKQVSTVDPKIAQVNTSISQTNDRVDEIDRRAQGASSAAAVADQKATAALQAANVADSKAMAASMKADSASQNVQQATNRMKSSDFRDNSGDTRGNSWTGYTAGTPMMIMFRVNSDALDRMAKQSLDAVATSVSGQQTGYLIEIHGFTDSTGSEMHNKNLSQRRAESTLRYLVGRGVPLHLISIIGLGEEKPIANNNVAGGREQNRRAEVRVLQSTAPRSN